MREALARQSESDTAASEPPAPKRTPPPAGWYAHPSMADTQRYWDGSKWTDHVAPGRPGVNSSPASRAVDPTYAWLVALLPLAATALIYFVPGTGALAVACIGLLVLTVALAEADCTRLKNQGIKINSGLALVLVPAYLFKRASRTGSSPALPIVWLGTAGLLFLGLFTFLESTDFDGYAESARIKAKFAEEGFNGAIIDCPDRAVRPGDTFTCTVDGLKYVSLITITMEEDGTYKWESE